MSLEDWMNQVALYCSSSGIVTDHQRIVTALTQLRSPATTYMKKYFDDNHLGKDLGSWDNFASELNAIYGCQDDKEGAKDEITQLWTNKTLASKDFIKYAEQYRTLAHIVDYQDGIHIDKLHGVISQELQNALVVFEVSGKTPNKWEDYLELLLMAYKALHPEKSKSVIFGTSNNKGNSSNDPNAMEIDMAKRSKGKAPKQANSQEPKYKPGNEDKWPASRPFSLSSPLTTGQGNTKGQPAQGAKKLFKARLLEIFDEMDNDEPAPPAAALNVNSMSITEIVPPGLAGKGAAAQVDEVQSRPSR
ncbi:hypothetical protein GYMLUDRAFT_248728 [Collybiopsis luxurians FD-317 M1]|uniref:Retrotransposon gag domain-containing protein n=1 Tax=Collybiopsis luxurians FD-317 M1 TaxID=944289 RepID=A0A0D0CJT5_9AGAR|nr:hypothetical protein GYMLUDRAFT_248728 [Collybiopsis luxurians FD-317 M1]